MKRRITRCDLSKCYRFNEYNEVISYGKLHGNVAGVKEQLERLSGKKDNYVKSIEKIVESEKEKEDTKYHMWERAFKAGEISKWILIGVIICFLMGMIFQRALPKLLANVLLLGGFLILPMFFAFVVAEVCAWVFGELYKKYIDKVIKTIETINNDFMQIARMYYEEIDRLYLSSLDPVHMEAVMQRREQERHNQEMLRLEKERVRNEAERFREQKRMSEIQERILAIEEEREKRYWKNRY